LTQEQGTLSWSFSVHQVARWMAQWTTFFLLLKAIGLKDKLYRVGAN